MASKILMRRRYPRKEKKRLKKLYPDYFKKNIPMGEVPDVVISAINDAYSTSILPFICDNTALSSSVDLQLASIVDMSKFVSTSR
jgi:hypothetical protein